MKKFIAIIASVLFARAGYPQYYTASLDCKPYSLNLALFNKDKYKIFCRKESGPIDDIDVSTFSYGTVQVRSDSLFLMDRLSNSEMILIKTNEKVFKAVKIFPFLQNVDFTFSQALLFEHYDDSNMLESKRDSIILSLQHMKPIDKELVYNDYIGIKDIRLSCYKNHFFKLTWQKKFLLSKGSYKIVHGNYLILMDANTNAKYYLKIDADSNLVSTNLPVYISGDRMLLLHR